MTSSTTPLAPHMPKLVAFDLDYTLWGLYIDCCSGPVKRDKDTFNSVTDRYGSPIGFFPEVPQILHDLAESKIHVAACSRTSATALATEALTKMILPPSKKAPEEAPRNAWSFFDTKEIYPGSKIRHFKELHKKTGIAFEDMLFFDDESRNKEVQSLGVTFVLVKHGMDRALWKHGVSLWQKRNPVASPPSNEDQSIIES